MKNKKTKIKKDSENLEVIYRNENSQNIRE